jgi:hypothetical protein
VKGRADRAAAGWGTIPAGKRPAVWRSRQGPRRYGGDMGRDRTRPATARPADGGRARARARGDRWLPTPLVASMGPGGVRRPRRLRCALPRRADPASLNGPHRTWRTRPTTPGSRHTFRCTLGVGIKTTAWSNPHRASLDPDPRRRLPTRQRAIPTPSTATSPMVGSGTARSSPRRVSRPAGIPNVVASLAPARPAMATACSARQRGPTLHAEQRGLPHVAVRRAGHEHGVVYRGAARVVTRRVNGLEAAVGRDAG